MRSPSAARATSAVVSIRGPTGLGTGFIVRKDGWIATNFHVISGSSAIVVATPDRHEYPVLDDPSAQAWAMRDAFDGLLEVIERKLGAR